MTRAEEGAGALNGTCLRLVTTDDVVEVVDEALDGWVVRFEPLDIEQSSDAGTLVAAEGIAAGLVAALPALQQVLDDSRGLRVVFSPEVRKALGKGSMRLMQTSQGTFLPTAVDQSGKIVETAAVAGATTAAVGVGLGSALVAAWPVLLAAGVAAAATAAHQRWMERTFAALDLRLEKIETRLRDDDMGALDAADSLMALARRIGPEALPQQTRNEIAAARLTVDGIYFSRRRFVERLIHTIQTRQIAFEMKKQERVAWADGVAGVLRKDGSTIDELVVFVRAMASRARLGAVSAALLLSEGAPLAALALLEELDQSIRVDYRDLRNPLAALTRTKPNTKAWDLLVDRGHSARLYDDIAALTRALEKTVGRQLAAHEEPLELRVPPGWQAA